MQRSNHISDPVPPGLLHLDLHTTGHYSGCYILGFAAAGNIAKQLCSACCKGLVPITNILCSLFNLSAANKEKTPKQTPPSPQQNNDKTPAMDNTGSVANEGSDYSHDFCSQLQKQRARRKSPVNFAAAVCTQGCSGALAPFLGNAPASP